MTCMAPPPDHMPYLAPPPDHMTYLAPPCGSWSSSMIWFTWSILPLMELSSIQDTNKASTSAASIPSSWGGDQRWPPGGGRGGYLGDKGYPHTCVRSDQLDEDLCPYVPEELLDVLSDELVLHDGSSVGVWGVWCMWGWVWFTLSHLTPTAPPTPSPYTPVGTQNLLKLHDVIILVSTDQTGHSLDLGVVLIRFGLGRRGHVITTWGRS